MQRRFPALGLTTWLLLGCGSSPPPAASASSSPPAQSIAAEPEQAPEPAEDAAPEPPEETEPEPSAAVEAPPPPSPSEALEELCEQTCDAMADKCTAAQIKKCKLSYCPKYATDERACEPAVREAFECARTHKDVLLCSNVVSDTCGKRFFAADECLATGKPPEKAVGETIPEGWARTQLQGTPFSAAFPPGVQQTGSGMDARWEASADGATYDVTIEPAPPSKKYDQKAFYRIASKRLGACVPKMKLFALIEEPTYSLIHYKTQCPDKTQERGVLYVLDGRLYVARARWTSGENPNAEAFAFAFQQRDSR